MTSNIRLVSLMIAIAAVSAAPATACLLEPCYSSWRLNVAVAPAPLFACPAGDAPSFADQGWTITISIRGCADEAVPNVPATDFWLADVVGGNVVLCGGHYASNADGPTNEQGMTTMSGTTLAAGGCADGMSVVAQGNVLMDEACSTYQVEPIHVRSPDIDGSLSVDVVDISLFAAAFPPNAYASCADMNDDGLIGLVDLAMFAAHFGIPGHDCQ